MTFGYSNTMSRLVAPQSEKADPAQVENSAGGHAFEVSKWGRLRRFLVLGSDAPTYYASARSLTRENATCVDECLAEDAPRTVAIIVDVSEAGAAPKNSPAIFALALAASHARVDARRSALDVLPRVCRTGTHLFEFVAYAQQHRGWGRALRSAVAKWYEEMSLDRLTYQVLKYQQRGGWSHRDVLRKAHPSTQDEARNNLLRWVAKKPTGPLPVKVEAYMAIHNAPTRERAVRAILDYGLTREMVPTELLSEPDVWAALLEHMPMTAMIRNLGKMSSLKMLSPMSRSEGLVLAELGDAERLRKSRVHPLSILVALNTYKRGAGVRGSLTWDVNTRIVDALDAAFYSAFGNVEPSNKRTMLALDVSGSMSLSEVAGMTGVTPRVGAAAMSLVTMRTEPQYHAMAFSRELVPLNISPRQRLDDVVASMNGLPFGGTDCAMPMIYALRNQIPVDTFIVYTDSETWAGRIHPHQALEQYRRKMGIDAKLIVVGMVSNGFTIAKPDDPGMLDVVGFDTAAPNVMAEFARGDMV